MGTKASLLTLLSLVRVLTATKADLVIENLALRQQLAVLKAKQPRPRFSSADRLFWVTLRRLWRHWQDVLVIVKPETVVRWHRQGFRLFWRWKSKPRKRAGRSPVSAEIRMLIRTMARQNPT